MLHAKDRFGHEVATGRLWNVGVPAPRTPTCSWRDRGTTIRPARPPSNTTQAASQKGASYDTQG